MILIAVNINGETAAVLTPNSTDLNLSLKQFSATELVEIDYYSLIV